MERNIYRAKTFYEVFVLEYEGDIRKYILHKLDLPSFAKYEHAKEWIEDEGKRASKYTILEVFQKS